MSAASVKVLRDSLWGNINTSVQPGIRHGSFVPEVLDKTAGSLHELLISEEFIPAAIWTHVLNKDLFYFLGSCEMSVLHCDHSFVHKRLTV